MHSKGNHKQNKKTIHRRGENICKQWDQKGLNFKIYKQLMQHNIKKKKKLMDIKSSYFSKVDMQVDKKHMKRCSAYLINRENEIKLQ